MTSTIIDNTPDSELPSVVYEHLLTKIPADNDFNNEYTIVLTFSKPEQAIYIIWCIETEINNGGFNQFYFNSSGQFAELAPDIFRLIGAPKFADLMTRANEVYLSEKKIIAQFCDGTVEGFNAFQRHFNFDTFDDEFYDLYKVESLQEIQARYIRTHKADFID